MKDKAPDGWLADDLTDLDDDIEIIEVIGLDENPSGGVEPGEAEIARPEDEVVLSLDGPDQAAGEKPAALAPGPPGDAGEAERQPVADDRLVRLQADFENFKKRVERERDSYHRHATAALVSRLLPVLDNFERALGGEPESAADVAFRDGVALIHRQLMHELRREGLKQVQAVGLPFDPQRHEAVATDATSDLPPNTILHEFQRGYYFQDRLLRPALVTVATDASDRSDQGPGDEKES